MIDGRDDFRMTVILMPMSYYTLSCHFERATFTGKIITSKRNNFMAYESILNSGSFCVTSISLERLAL